MDGVGTPIIGRPRPLPGHDTANPAHNTYTLKCEEPFWCVVSSVKGVATTPRIWQGCCPLIDVYTSIAV